MGDRWLDVAFGANAPSIPELQALTARYHNLRIQVETPTMALLTSQADIAIGGGGSSVWERCVLGAPSVTIVLADNQAENTAALAAARATVALDANGGDFESRLIESFRRLRDDHALCAGVGGAAAALCDGQGARRVAERVLALV
jgi:spore coat polysaccharide biosynthesis predicted glycosyltransferase SpsG